MKFLAVAATLSLATLASADSSCCLPTDEITSHENHERLVQDYLSVWSGNVDILPDIMAPDFKLYADLFPFGPNGPAPLEVNSRDAFKGLVLQSRSGWQEYAFEVLRWTGSGYSHAIRWYMHGITGNLTNYPTPLGPGEFVEYNGTDFVTLDECTGLIKEVDMAQDIITYYHNLQLGSVTVNI